MASQPAAPDRRSVPRFAADLRAARLAWRAGPSRYPKAAARLIDISTWGASLTTRVVPTRGQAVWLGMEGLPMEWARATVVAVATADGRSHCRLAFDEGCPAGLVEAARFGPDDEGHDAVASAWDPPDRDVDAEPWESTRYPDAWAES